MWTGTVHESQAPKRPHASSSELPGVLPAALTCLRERLCCGKVSGTAGQSQAPAQGFPDSNVQKPESPGMRAGSWARALGILREEGQHRGWESALLTSA